MQANTIYQRESGFSESFRKDWSEYADKYNALSKKLVKARINPKLLAEVEDLRVNIELKYGKGKA
ncbi:hypothetical protein [Lutispora sp.]|uniref:hypothetical protein n=1 Tax=Lutispora sp. TaxID=2828727 RepID=UPI00356AEC60